MIAFHMHGHITSSRVCVHGVGYSPFLVNVCGELGNGTTSKIEIHGCVKQ